MQVRRLDHRVDFVREERIAEIALEWRTAAANENNAYFNITDFVRNILAKRSKKGPIVLSIVDRLPNDEPAYVSFKPTTLHVNREIWELAERGEPEARYIIAHEIGHLILHDHDAKAYSDDPKDQIRFAEKEYSAEWQANTFADNFLAPRHVVNSIADPVLISRKCSITRLLAEERVAFCGTTVRSGDACTECGNFTIVGNGACLECNTCANTSGCS